MKTFKGGGVLVSIWGVSGWLVSNFQSPFSGSSVIFHLLKLDFLVAQEDFRVCVGLVYFVFEAKKWEKFWKRIRRRSNYLIFCEIGIWICSSVVWLVWHCHVLILQYGFSLSLLSVLSVSRFDNPVNFMLYKLNLSFSMHLCDNKSFIWTGFFWFIFLGYVSMFVKNNVFSISLLIF